MKNKKIFLLVFVCFLCIGLVSFIWSKYNEIWFLKFNLDSEFSLAIDGNNKVIQYIPLNDNAMNKYTDNDFINISIKRVLEKLVDDSIDVLSLSVIDDNNNKINKRKNKVISIVKNINNKVNPSFLDVTDEEIEVYNKFTRINVSTAAEDVYDDLNINIGSDKAGKSNMISHKKLSGSDRHVTAINVSKEVYPDGSDNVILVGEKNVDGDLTTDLADGYLASSLANVIDAPVLFVNNNSVGSSLSAELDRLNAKTIYLIGGSAVISDNVKNSLDNDERDVIRLTASGNGYSTDTGKIGTSITVAKEVKKHKSFNSIILAPDKTDLIDSALMSFISAKEGIPIIYSSSSSLSSGISTFLTENNISKVYLVGGSSFYDAVKGSIGENKIVNLSGGSRYDTNSNIISEFYDSFDSVVVVNSDVELVISSQLANKTNSIVMYTNDNNDNEFVDSQINLIRNNDIDNLYYLGNSKVKVAFRNMMYQINKSNCNDSVECLLFMKSRAVFYIPHQDDETSFHSQSILNAIKNLGAENVFVVFMTDGNSSVVTKDKILIERLKEVGRTFTEQRDLESTNALLDFGVLPENIQFVEDLDFVNQSRFVDGNLRNNINSLKKVMIAYDNKYGGDITHFSYTPYFDKHYDHLSLGQALMELYFDSTIKDDSFSNVYSVIRVDVNEKYPGIDNYKNYSKKLLTLNYYNDDFKNRTISAIGRFVHPEEDVKFGDIKITGTSDVGIGYASGRGAFDTFIRDYLDTDSLYTPIHVPFYKD